MVTSRESDWGFKRLGDFISYSFWKIESVLQGNCLSFIKKISLWNPDLAFNNSTVLFHASFPITENFLDSVRWCGWF